MTTLEMDCIFTEEDAKNRNTVMLQCKNCKKWTMHINYLISRKYSACLCGNPNFDSTSIKSVRTYRPEVDNKRKVK